jgi:hypothetical protein
MGHTKNFMKIRIMAQNSLCARVNEHDDLSLRKRFMKAGQNGGGKKHIPNVTEFYN